MTDPALTKLISTLGGSMSVGTITVVHCKQNEILVEIKDHSGWLMHSCGPVKLPVGCTLNIAFPPENK